jgi:hypothetical protein
VGDSTLRRRGDKYLIPAFYDAIIRDSELVAANRCRLHLRVVTLAGICDGSGDHVTDAAWLGHRDSDRPQYYEWPAQGYPSGGDCTKWRKAIAHAFDVSNHSRALPLALGPWSDPPDTWRWFLSENDDRLYYRSAPNVWQFCIRHPRRTRNYVFKNQLFDISNPDLPDDLRRTVISRCIDSRVWVGQR